MENTQAGWYPDPSGDVTKLRYWNGTQWTNDVADAQPSVNQTAMYTNPTYAQPGYSQPYYRQDQYYVDSSDGTLRLIAFILCIISTVAAGWMIIPLAWMIPMSVHCWGIYKGTKSNTTAFGVCTLLFVNIIGGILLLASKKDV